MSLHREIILGPPGTGKTTELIKRLDEAFASGVMPEEVALLAFTKKAADVAIQRSMQHFGFTRNRFPYFRTIHSLAFHENKISSQSVMRQENYKELGLLFGWDFDAAYENFEERPQYGNGLGDHLLRCYDLAKARGVDVKVEARSGEYPFGEFAIEQFCNQFEAYKKKYSLLTFNDFLERPIDLDLKLVIVDEAQDLTHLQWSFIRGSFRRCPLILIAGDDDQCLYQWSGADLNFFLKIEANVTKLGQSHRCDQRIWELANRISTRIGRRYDKPWKSVNAGGEVRIQRDPHEVDLSHGEWLVLVRKNRALNKYREVCMQSGRIFHDGFAWMNEKTWFKGVVAYMHLVEGRPISAAEAMALLKVTSRAAKKIELPEFHWEDFQWGFEGRPNWDWVCDKLDFEHLAYIRKCIANGESLFSPGRIRLSTIHAAKGGEADNVLLDMKLDGIPLRQFRKDPDSERRVWYVGVSRARHKLILSGAFKNAAVDI
jgi:superfamily I DNA/RNA helicase